MKESKRKGIITIWTTNQTKYLEENQINENKRFFEQNQYLSQTKTNG